MTAIKKPYDSYWLILKYNKCKLTVVIIVFDYNHCKTHTSRIGLPSTLSNLKFYNYEKDFISN